MKSIDKINKKIEAIETQLDVRRFRVVQLSKNVIEEFGLERRDLISCWINRDGSISDSATAGTVLCEMDGDTIIRVIKPSDPDYHDARVALRIPDLGKAVWLEKMRADNELRDKILSDPEATELACKLFERITIRQEKMEKSSALQI
ncbi:MAG: hypothetical protein PHU34_09350 [Candidatus Methanoperedens sp.]|nr:hypothetical protein [Candidatus Methanoperedens sp.]